MAQGLQQRILRAVPEMPCTQGWHWASAGFGASVQQQRVLVPSPRRTGLLGVADSHMQLTIQYHSWETGSFCESGGDRVRCVAVCDMMEVLEL